MRPMICLAAAAFAGTFVCGCGENSGPKMYGVRGTVSLDGTAITHGDVIFEAADGSSTEAGQIKDGKFEFRSRPGPKHVSIRASKKKYGRPGIGPRGENFILVRMIPKKYDLPQNRLKAEVRETNDESANRFEFNLTSEASPSDVRASAKASP